MASAASNLSRITGKPIFANSFRRESSAFGVYENLKTNLRLDRRSNFMDSRATCSMKDRGEK